MIHVQSIYFARAEGRTHEYMTRDRHVAYLASAGIDPEDFRRLIRTYEVPGLDPREAA